MLGDVERLGTVGVIEAAPEEFAEDGVVSARSKQTRRRDGFAAYGFFTLRKDDSMSMYSTIPGGPDLDPPQRLDVPSTQVISHNPHKPLFRIRLVANAIPHHHLQPRLPSNDGHMTFHSPEDELRV